jgi:hypothetical protein
VNEPPKSFNDTKPGASQKRRYTVFQHPAKAAIHITKTIKTRRHLERFLATRTRPRGRHTLPKPEVPLSLEVWREQ